MSNPRLEAWWRAQRDEWTTKQPPTAATVSASASASASAWTWSSSPGVAGFADALRSTFPDYLRERFVLPPDLAALVELLDGQYWRTADEWHELWSPDVIVANLALEVRVHDDRDLVETAGPWVQFARSGDHGHFFLSCDAARSHVGHVLEGDDDHPWLENGLLRGLGRESLRVDGARPLVVWLEQWRARPDERYQPD